MKPLSVLLVLLAWATGFSQRAYGPVNFGDSMPEVAHKLVALDEVYTGAYSITRDNRDPVALLQWASKHVVIDGHRFYMDFEFYDGKLFRFSLSTSPVTANYFDTTVIAARNTLVGVVSDSHGTSSAISNVGFLDMRSGFIIWSHVWNPNEQGVAYKIGLGETVNQYSATMWVEWTWLANLYDEAVRTQQEQSEGDVRSRF